MLKVGPSIPKRRVGPTMVQVWAVWAEDFDKRVMVEVDTADCTDWEDAEIAAKMLGASRFPHKRVTLVGPDEVLARYVLTRTKR